MDLKIFTATVAFGSVMGTSAFAGAPAFEVNCQNTRGTTFSMGAEGCTSEFHLKRPKEAKGLDLVTDCSSKPEEAILVSQNAKSRFVFAATSEVLRSPGETDQLILASDPASFVVKSNRDGIEDYSFTGTVTHFFRRDGVKSSRSERVSCVAESIFDF